MIDNNSDSIDVVIVDVNHVLGMYVHSVRIKYIIVPKNLHTKYKLQILR